MSGDGGHGEHCDGCLMLGFVTRLQKAEAQIDVLTRAVHLSTVGAEPMSKWLDARMAAIDETYAGPDSEPTS
jgi:hypothetical protein